MNITNKDLKKRIIEISYKNKLSHLGSCLTAVDIIEEIYQSKKDNEPFILSQGHAGLALYVVLDKYYGLNAEKLWRKHGTHPNRDMKNKIWCSTGSLGHGLPIAVGMALADKKRKVYCLISDGECAEGSIWEALKIKEKQKLNNLLVFVNVNGYSAYGKVNSIKLWQRLNSFTNPLQDNYDPTVFMIETVCDYLPFLRGIDAHYYIMNEKDYKLALKILK